VIVHLVSMSGGKDSTATALLALELHGRDACRFVFADTGNEHQAVYDYLAYLESALGIEIIRLKRDLSDEWWHRRDYVREVWPTKLVKEGYSNHDEIVTRALSVLDQGPTGNPYLDLCILKSRFPSRRAQFCTQCLKTEPLTELAMSIIDNEGAAVWSWQGIRAEESPHRAREPEFEEVGGGLYINRPIKRWKASDVFDAHRAAGIEPNPLYKLGMGRVGCMPCINANKAEIREIARRFPEHIDRIAKWEAVVALTRKGNVATFFAHLNDGSNPSLDDIREAGSIRAVVQWAKTTRGGKQFDLLGASEELPACSSSYGLCE